MCTSEIAGRQKISNSKAVRFKEREPKNRERSIASEASFYTGSIQSKYHTVPERSAVNPAIPIASSIYNEPRCAIFSLARF